jgi:hypothetical protein
MLFVLLRIVDKVRTMTKKQEKDIYIPDLIMELGI